MVPLQAADLLGQCLLNPEPCAGLHGQFQGGQLQPLNPEPQVLTRSTGAAQAYVAKAKVDSFSLVADLMYVASNAPRICRALFEITLRRGWPQAAELILSFCKVRCLMRSICLTGFGIALLSTRDRTSEVCTTPTCFSGQC